MSNLMIGNHIQGYLSLQYKTTYAFFFYKDKGTIIILYWIFSLKWEQPHVVPFQVSLYGLKGLHMY